MQIKNFTLKLIQKLKVKRPSLLNNTIALTTNKINRNFAILLIALCFSASVYSYYEQNLKNHQRLMKKTQHIVSSLNQQLNSKKTSLISMANNSFWKEDSLTEKNIAEMLRYYENSSFTNLIWSPKNNLKKSYCKYGEIKDKILFIDVLNGYFLQNLTNNILIQETFSTNREIILLLTTSTRDIKENIFGYLSLPTNLSELIENAADNISSNEIIRIGQKNKNQYFHRENIALSKIDNIDKNNYIFSKNTKISDIYLNVSIGIKKEVIIKRLKEIILQRCALIIITALMMSICYNVLETQKAKKLYNKVFSQKLNECVNETFLQKSEIKNLKEELRTIKGSMSIHFYVQEEIYKELHNSLTIIDKSHEILIDYLTGKKKFEESAIVKTLESTTKIIKDLYENIFSHYTKLDFVNVDQVLNEIRELLTPALALKSITIKNKPNNPSKGYEIKCNRLLLYQTIFNVFIRSIYSSVVDSEMNIELSSTSNEVTIEIVNEGYNIDESMIKATLNNSNLFSFTNLFLDIENLRKVVMEVGASLTFKSDKGNHTAEIKFNKMFHSEENLNNNVTQFTRFLRRNE